MNRTEPLSAPAETSQVGDLRNPEVAHESSDIRVRVVGWFMFWLMIGLLVVVVLMWGLFRWLAYQEKTSEPAPRSLVGQGQERLPPEPRLQLAPGHTNAPQQDYQQFRAAEETRLNSFGWVNQATGNVHIPLPEARRKFLEQQSAQPTSSPPPPATRPTESSSGRALERNDS
jgi:hypothetical protein